MTLARSSIGLAIPKERSAIKRTCLFDSPAVFSFFTIFQYIKLQTLTVRNGAVKLSRCETEMYVVLKTAVNRSRQFETLTEGDVAC